MNKKRFVVSSLVALGLTTLYLRSPLAKVNVSKQKHITVDDVKDIRLNVASADIEIVPSDSEDIVVTLTGKQNKFIQENISIQVEYQFTKMNINYKVGHPVLSLIDGSKYDTKIKLEIPNEKVEILQIHASSGDIHIKHIVCDEVVARTASGDQTFIKTRATKQLNAKAKSGDITAENIHTNKAIFCTNSGDIILNGEQLKMDAAFTTSSGDVTVKFLQIPTSVKVDFKGKSGQAFIDIDELTLEEKSKHRILAIKGTGGDEIKVERMQAILP